MVEAELVINTLTLGVVLVVLVLVSIAYYRSRLQQLVVLFLLAALLALNMVVSLAEELLEDGLPYLDPASSLLSLGIAVLLFVTVLRRFSGRA